MARTAGTALHAGSTCGVKGLDYTSGAASTVHTARPGGMQLSPATFTATRRAAAPEKSYVTASTCPQDQRSLTDATDGVSKQPWK